MDITVRTLLERLLEPCMVHVHIFDIDDDLFDGTADDAIREYGDCNIVNFDVGHTELIILVEE